MINESSRGGNAIKLIVYWVVVSVPLAWGIWLTILKLPALFK
jgi:hypothetical protein